MDYIAPDTLADACRALEADGSQCLAGGQSLVAMMNLGLAAPDRLVSLRHVAELHGIETMHDGGLRIGAMTTHAELAELAAHAPGASLLAQTARVVAYPAVRTRGTIGGSVALADPAADYPVALVAMDAVIEIASAARRRSVPAREFFRGMFETALERGEIVCAIRVPPGPAGAGAAYEKLSLVAGDFAILSVAAIAGKDVRAAIGGYAMKPILLSGLDASDALQAATRQLASRRRSAGRPARDRRLPPSRRAGDRPARRMRRGRESIVMSDRKLHRTLSVNGSTHEVLARADATLLDVLRDQLDLCGTKRGCNHGVCGACNVLVDGALVRSCLMLAVEAGERPVVTVEGVAADRPFSDVQRALIDAGAIQCGFCTPGFVMALTALFQRDRAPDARSHPRRAVGQPVPVLGLREDPGSGRASGWSPGMTRRAVPTDVHASAMNVAQPAVSSSPPRLEAGDKATGRARYADDVRLPGMLHAAIHTSPHAHARILGYRTRRGARDPGRARDRHGRRHRRCPLRRHRQGRDDARARQGAIRRRAGRRRRRRRRDHRVARRGRHRGRVRAAARRLLPRRGAGTGRAGPARGVRRLRQVGRWRRTRQRRVREHRHRRRRRPGVRRVRRDRRKHLQTQAQHHVYLETNGCVADADGSGRITLYVTCQSVHHVQQRVAEELAEPMARIRAIATRVGGGFGGKHASNLHSIAAWLARAARRPVKLVLSRMQDFEIQRSRHPARIWMKTGARSDGTIVARDVRITLDGGAYADESPAVLAFALADVARSLPHRERARERASRLYEQAARRIVSRIRQPAGDLRRGIAARRSRGEARHRPGASCGCATR